MEKTINEHRVECHSYIAATGEANMHCFFDNSVALMEHVNRQYAPIPGFRPMPAMIYIAAPYGTAFQNGFSHSRFEMLDAWDSIPHERFNRDGFAE